MYRWVAPDEWERMEQVGAERIGASVLRGRLQLGLSQRQLAWRVRVAQSTISRLENGKLRGIGFKKLATIVAVLSEARGFQLAGEPASPTRRLPGQRSA